jgi:hypothetical protein
MGYPIRVNGNDYSWGSIVLKINGEVFSGFTEISYSDKRTRTKGYGAGKHQAPTRRARGKYEVDNCKIKGYMRDVRLLRQELAKYSPSGKSYGDTPIQIDVEYIEADDTPIHDEIEDCVWASNSQTASEGPDLLMVEFELDPMRVRRDGLVLFDDSEGGVT